jgi:16S rRNA (cytidine1402-2'-O)-methyltransferase
VARELTKLYETVRRGSLPALAAEFGAEPPPKGEIVVLIGQPVAAERHSEADLDKMLREALAGHSLKDAVALVAGATGLPRREVYQRALKLGEADT